jgi:hypothetical protein
MPRMAATLRIAETEVRSLGALVDRVTPTVDERSGHRRAPLVYRGTSRDTPLLTSLDVLGGSEPPHTKVDLECHVLRSYARYARAYLPNAMGWEVLVSARHHGVPTRLLDWAASPLVAAHFATLRAAGEAAVIWQLDWRRVHVRFGLPELALTLDDLRARFGEGPPLHASAAERFLDGEKFACLIEPPSMDARIAAQTGTFTLSSDTRCALDAFLTRHDLADALHRFVIPADRVPVVRDQLDLLGMDERRIFPDLDGVAAAIRRYYE